jgi:hypothetical protein
MAPLLPEMPSSDKVLNVFYDFETTQDTKVTQIATLHVPNLVCVQQFCTSCDAEQDVDKDCEKFGKRKHTWEDPVCELLYYLCKSCPNWATKVVFIVHNARAYVLHFVLKRAILKN